MSYVTLKIIKENKVEDFKEYKNAHGGAAFIWDAIYTKYLKNPDIKYDSWIFGADKLWPLYEDERLPEYQRIVLASTYDNVVIEFDKLQRLAECFREFVNEFENKERVCHLSGYADELDWISKNETEESCQGICFYQMSVSDDPWVYNELFIDDDGDEDTEQVPYDLTRGDKHWFLFKRLDYFTAA